MKRTKKKKKKKSLSLPLQSGIPKKKKSDMDETSPNLETSQTVGIRKGKKKAIVPQTLHAPNPCYQPRRKHPLEAHAPNGPRQNRRRHRHRRPHQRARRRRRRLRAIYPGRRIHRHSVDAQSPARPVDEAPRELGLEALAAADHAHVVCKTARRAHGVGHDARGGGWKGCGQAGAGAEGDDGAGWEEEGGGGREGEAEAHLALEFAGDEEGLGTAFGLWGGVSRWGKGGWEGGGGEDVQPFGTSRSIRRRFVRRRPLR